MILQASHFCDQHPFPILNACSKSYSRFLLDDFLTTLKVSVLSHDFQNWNPAMLPRLPQTNHFISYFIEKIWQSLPQIPTSRHTILLNACFYFVLLSSAEAHVEGSYSLISPQKYFLIGFPIIFMHLAISSQSGPFTWIFIYTCMYTYIDVGSIPGLGRSLGEGNGNPLQYSCLENFMDRGAWWVRVHGITMWQTWTEWLTLSYLSVQFSCSVLSPSWRPHELQHSRPPCPPPSRSLLKLMPIKLVMPSSHLILCRPLLLLPPIPPSISVFFNELTLYMRWPKYWSFSFSVSPSSEHPGLISFRMDWFDLLAIQGTLKSLLQHHSSKASVLQRSAFFTVQLSHPSMTTGKTIALTRRTFVG